MKPKFLDLTCRVPHVLVLAYFFVLYFALFFPCSSLSNHVEQTRCVPTLGPCTNCPCCMECSCLWSLRGYVLLFAAVFLVSKAPPVTQQAWNKYLLKEIMEKGILLRYRGEWYNRLVTHVRVAETFEGRQFSFWILLHGTKRLLILREESG